MRNKVQFKQTNNCQLMSDWMVGGTGTGMGIDGMGWGWEKGSGQSHITTKQYKLTWVGMMMITTTELSEER